MSWIWVALCLLAVPLRADELTRRLTPRLTEEAAAFERTAIRVLGTETLVQRAQKPPRRFRLRVGEGAKRDPQIEWQTRTIVSEYGFTTLGTQNSLHELRQVTSVDGKAVKNKGPEELAKLILAADDDRKRALLEQFASHGLRGAVTDFGQLILLFTPANISRFEFTHLRAGQVNETAAQVFRFQQIDGPNPMTVLEAGSDKAQAVPVEGEIWVNADTMLPLRIVLRAETGLGRQEATVDYAMSGYGVLLPVRTDQRELRDGQVFAENHFTYSGFRRFGASAEIVFEPEDPR